MVKGRHEKKTFLLIIGLYFTINFYIGILPANIDNLITDLSGATQSGIALVIMFRLVFGTISMLLFGYFGEVLGSRFGKKRLFVLMNALSIGFNGLIIFSFNYWYFLTFSIISSITNGAFLPIGFSIVSDLYSSKERGGKFGMLQFSLVLSNGLGVALGGFLGWRVGFSISFFMGIACLGTYLVNGTNSQLKPEFENLDGETQYNYKITMVNFLQLLKTKTILGIMISVLCYGIAISTLANWGIYYLTLRLKSVNSLSGIILNIGGIIGNMVVSTLVQINLLSFSIILVLFVWLCGSFSWIIPI